MKKGNGDVWCWINSRNIGRSGVTYQLISFKSDKLLGCAYPAAGTCFFLHTLVETFNVHDDALMYP